MEIVNLFPGSFASNCYLLSANGEAAVVDPSADTASILAALAARDADLKYILLTHGHFDHVLSLDTLRDATGAPAAIHTSDADMLTSAQKNAFRYFFGSDRIWRAPERCLANGDELELGGEIIRVIHTPGHSMGSVCFRAEGLLLTGDTLFDGNVGRCDLYGGDPQSLANSLRTLRTLPPELIIHPGHGATARLGDALSALF